METPREPSKFTSWHLDQLKQLAEESAGNARMPAAKLMRLASEWSLDYSELAREYVSVTLSVKQRQRDAGWKGYKKPEPPQRVNQPEQRDSAQQLAAPLPSAAPPAALPRQSFLATQRPVIPDVAGIQAAPGSVAVQGSNWVLIDARIRKGLNPSDVGRSLNPPLTRRDYLRIEEGRLLPAADHAAQLCTMLEVAMEEAFALAGPAMADGRATYHKGLSVIGVLRVRKRFSMKTLGEAIEAQTRVKVPSAFLGRIEKNEVHPEKLDAAQIRFADAIAQYFEIPREWVFRQLPAQLVSQAAANAKRLHALLKETYQQLQRVEADVPYLLSSGGETK